MKKEKPSVVVMGGGTGTYGVLNALREQDVALTALMTMVDDGGSNKIIRDEFGLLPTSGIRQAMVALSENQSLMRDLFTYRFHRGEGIAGMTFGNLFMAAMADILGSQESAIDETAKILSVKGKILPISFDDVRLVASYEDGSEVVGEHRIDEPEHDGKLRIVHLRTEPKATITEKARKAIQDADLIILGPGDFYTNTVANLVIEGVVDALLDCNALIVFVMNLMTKFGEAYDYAASDYLKDMGSYFPLHRLNAVIMNNDTNFPNEAIEKYESEFQKPVVDDLDGMDMPRSMAIIRSPLLSSQVAQPQKGDTLSRSMIRHDQEKLGAVLMTLIEDLTSPE